MDKWELVFKSNGKEYRAKDKILSLEGFAASDYEVNISKNALYDGGNITGIKISSRNINVQFEEDNRNKNRLLNFFNPKYDGTLYATIGTVTKYINYRVERFGLVQKNLSIPPVISVDLICPDPYFYDVKDDGRNIAGRQALFAFPFIWQRDRGLVSDYKVFTDQTLVVNDGDVETGLTVEFRCTGAVENPKIELVSTGEYMRILKSCEAGDTILFETNTANKNIYVNGEKYTNFDPASTFFSLREGENVLKYGSDSGYEALDVYVHYRAKYLGVV